MKKMLLAAGIALATISTAAVAAVTFDPATGTGFVGKGDIQLAFGWNNKAAQDNATALVQVSVAG
jgi:opacity protein-like surface antigen